MQRGFFFCGEWAGLQNKRGIHQSSCRLVRCQREYDSGTLSAQFEHTIGVTGDGYEIFTESQKNLHFPPYNLKK